jgi:hemolysin D
METHVTNSPDDPGFFVLEILLRLLGVGTDPEQLRQAVGRQPVGIEEMVNYARTIGLAARCLTSNWAQLSNLPLPAIAVQRNRSFLVLGRVTDDMAIVLVPRAARPVLMTRSDFEALWDGRLILVKKRSGFAIRWRRIATTWSRRTQGATRTMVERLQTTLRRAATPGTDNANPTQATAGSSAIVVLADHARKIGRAIVPSKPAENGYRAQEIAFLPAALEILESPPSPLGRAIAFSIVAIFSIALIWACLGTVDIVAIASGKLIPSSRTKTIQPFETGVVRSIEVRDGQSVKSGDVLMTLDTTISDADLGRLKSDLMAARFDVARLKAALSGKRDPLAAFIPPNDAPPNLVEMHRRFLISQIAEQNAKLGAIDGQVAQKEAERTTFKASIAKLRATLTPLQQRVEIRQQLFQKELGSKLTYLSELQELVGQQQEILIQQSRSNEADAAITVLAETRSKAVAEYERALLDGLAKAEEKAAGLVQDVIKAEQRTSLQILKAPIDGTVQQLAVHTIGGVVTPAQMLMLVVPTESRLEIEAMISNRDIGFVEVGQDAAIKIDTFNFTRYGLLQGKVLVISQDAITRNKSQDKTGDAPGGAQTTSSEPKGQELVYAARISLDRTQMEIENKRVNLSPGMAVTVEIKNGSRSIISYLLSPLLRYKQESLRER